jgi:hypothetical protein
MIKFHFIFDVKMGKNFRRNTQLDANHNETKAPTALMYSSGGSRDSVKIAFLVASLSDLQLLSCDIQNAYLTADCQEKIYIV